MRVIGLSLTPRSAANISMLDEINDFFDELRTPFEWPDHFPEIDPISNVNVRAHCEKHHHLAMLALDKTEFHLLEIYRAGGGSVTAHKAKAPTSAVERPGSCARHECSDAPGLRSGGDTEQATLTSGS